MQFSIFGVLFKCTKEMFTWEKIRSTCFINWAINWRVFLVSYLLTPIVSTALESHEKDLGVVYFSLLGLHLFLSFLIYYYCKYVVLYKIPFRTFERNFIHTPNNLKFYSWYFWKPQFLSMVLASLMLISLFLIGGTLWYLLPKSQTGSQLLMLVFAAPCAFVCICLITDHVFIHGGTYEIVFESVNALTKTVVTKKPSVLERIKLSFPYLFTSFGAGLLVSLYIFVVIVFFLAICFTPIYLIESETLTNSQMTNWFIFFGYSIPVTTYFLVNYYIEYDTLYKFPYRSTDRLYSPKTVAPKLWSIKFLSTFILVLASKILLTLGFLTLIFVMFDNYEFVDLFGVSYFIASIFVSVSFISFGAWGFVPVRKEAIDTESTSKSHVKRI